MMHPRLWGWWITLGIMSLVGPIFGPIPLYANFEITNLQKMVVFPPLGLEERLADEVWWQVRELLTQDKKFMVATRRLMINRQVLQARAQMKPAEVVVLAKVLEAQSLLSLSIVNAKAQVFVYRGEDGLLAWQGTIALDPARPAQEQVQNLFLFLVKQFLKAIPYGGYQVRNPISGSEFDVFEDELHVFIQTPRLLKVGDKVYWKQIYQTQLPLLSPGYKTQTLAEGQIYQVLKDQTYQVRVPLSFRAVIESHLHHPIYLDDLGASEVPSLPIEHPENKKTEYSAEFLVKELKETTEIAQQNPVATFVGFLVNFALIVLIAF